MFVNAFRLSGMPRPRRYDDDLRRRLLDVSSEAISSGGAQGLSLRVVASRAGTTTAAIYTLFGSRDHLIKAVIAEGLARFAAHLDAVAHTADPGVDLLALGVAYRDSALDDPHFYRVLFGPGITADPIEPEEHATFDALRQAVRRLTGGPEADITEHTYQLWSVVHGLVDLELAGLLPGTTTQRGERYVATLRAVGPALLRT